ncbi:hypothetical protein DAPPUDRAFT_114407 [Daphnia pulex]|uniref:Uncharacterized protein n=1 Tax=Daphnia pulex TaxID=6669 RepID=E9HI14_DAPPU|nr:hypothetical protein DAPPUDRAFT_114407 [Daphnia pulex]|eukprot:EFX68573.1 hypothetical protein DAPPUDRAFT_114407 [Daphnia pulex]
MANIWNQPLTREQLLAQQKTIKLTTDEEIIATGIRRILFWALTTYLSPLLSNDIKSKGKDLESNRKIDAFFSFKVMIQEFQKDRNFFDHYDHETQSILYTAMLGRNAVIHSYLPILLLDGEKYLLSWIAVCRLINQTVAADQLQHLYQQVYAGAISPLRNQTDINFSLPDFVKPFLLRPDNMSVKDFDLSLKIQVKMFEAESVYFGPALRAYIVKQPWGSNYFNSVVDSQTYLEDLITRSPTNKQYNLLRDAKFARNKLCHAELIPLLENQDEFLISWIEVCDKLGEVEASAKILKIRNFLKSLNT